MLQLNQLLILLIRFCVDCSDLKNNISCWIKEYNKNLYKKSENLINKEYDEFNSVYGTAIKFFEMHSDFKKMSREEQTNHLLLLKNNLEKQIEKIKINIVKLNDFKNIINNIEILYIPNMENHIERLGRLNEKVKEFF